MPDSTHEKPATQLRVEAGPAQWAELDSAQCTAYLKLAGMVSEALSAFPSRGSKGDASARLRRTQTAFVMGGRGTGKTTVLETLRNDSITWTRDQTASVDAPASALERDARMKSIAGRVVWLETLDMEPLPPDANLLAAILVRLEDAARTHGVKEGQQSERSRGLLEPSSDYHAALLELQRLQTDVALAWDGNLRERKGQLDPDTFAVEMMRVEQARLSLNRRFSDTFDSLAEHVFHTTSVHNPLFILPVDDFDLNPPTCLDLLRVLRMISIPRLFTIVLGDLQVAQTVLSLKLSHDIGAIADARIHRDMLAVDIGVVGALAGDVAGNAIRKLLPPSHRVELEPMSVWEALNFRPLGASSEPALHQLFAECPVYVQWKLPPLTGVEANAPDTKGSNGASLRRLMTAPPLVSVVSPTPTKPVAFTSASIKAAVYSGRRVVEAPPRRVADMWLGVRKMGEPAVDDERATERILAHFAEVCRSALRETSLFGPEQRRYIDRAISQTVGGSWTLRALPLLITAETTPATPVDLVDPNTPPAFITAPRFLLFEALDWRVSVLGPTNRRVGSQAGVGGLGTPPPGLGPDPWEQQLPVHALPESTTSALIVYHDLLTFTRHDSSFVTPLLTPTNLRVDWAATEWRVGRPVRFEWPAPPVSTFFDLDCLKAAWNTAIKSREIADVTSKSEKVERLLFAWISAGTAALTQRPAVRLSARSEPRHWQELIGTLQELTASSRDGDRDWLLRVCEILMPEISAQGIVQVFFNTPVMDFWRRHRIAIMQRRAERLAELASSDRELAENLRRGSPEDFMPPPVANANEPVRQG